MRRCFFLGLALVSVWVGCGGDDDPAAEHDAGATTDAGMRPDDGGIDPDGGTDAAVATDGGADVDAGPAPVDPTFGDLTATRDACMARTEVDPGATYVDPGGSDAAGCGAIDAPCQSIDFAYESLANGAAATIYLRGGTYGRPLTTSGRRRNGASADAQIHVTSYPGEWAVLDVTGSGHAFKIDGDSFVRVSCIEAMHFGGKAVWIVDPAHDVEIDHLLLHDSVATDGGINPAGIGTLSGTHHLHLHHNEIWNVSKPASGTGVPHNFHGIVVFDSYMTVGRGDIEVDHNLIHDVGTGIRFKHAGTGPHPLDSMHHNVVYGAGWGLAGGAEYLEIHHNIVWANEGVVLQSDGSHPGGSYHHNTLVVRRGLWIPSMDDPLGGTTARFDHNLVMDATTAIALHPDTPALGASDDNVFAVPTFEWARPGHSSPMTTLAAWQTDSGYDASSVVATVDISMPATVTLASAVAAATPSASWPAFASVCPPAGAIGALPCP